MKGKQLIYTIISIVFFGASVVIIYVNFLAPKKSATQLPPPGLTQVSVEGQGTSNKPILPYGTDLNFEILQSYNNGSIPPFPYELVTPEQIGVGDHNQLVKPDVGL